MARAAGVLITAGIWNEDTQSDWAAYTPTWLTAGAGADPTLGNGTIAGRWTKAAKLVTVRIKLTWGSTTSGGSGAWTFSMPVGPLASTVPDIGHALSIGGGPASYKHDVAIMDNDTVARCLSMAIGDFYSATIPHTWATGNNVVMQLQYEAA